MPRRNKMSIYTKSGDKGETGLLGGRRVSKSTPRIVAIGEIDELNAALGVLCALKREEKEQEKVIETLHDIQSDLFMIGAELADPEKKSPALPLQTNDVQKLEQWIDEREKKLPELKNFILPGGTPFAAHAHLARAICRRAERTVVALHEKESINPQIIIYLNRLSDLLFMLAREDIYEKRGKEILWKS